MIDHYDWSGGREAMMRFGPTDGPVVVASLPLFEEANRTRAFVVTILRALARQGFTALLPDLPGTSESLVPTADARLLDWRAAFAAAGNGPVHAISIRGGALVPEGDLRSHWQFSPVDGEAQHRELIRLRSAGDGQMIAGNQVSDQLLEELLEARQPAHAPTRIVRFESDPRDAHRKLPGSPLWRRAEPDNDPALAQTLADDIAQWVCACAG